MARRAEISIEFARGKSSARRAERRDFPRFARSPRDWGLQIADWGFRAGRRGMSNEPNLTMGRRHHRGGEDTEMDVNATGIAI